MYLERRRRLWYALHDVPADAQARLGRKRLVESLKTQDKTVAQRRAALLEARWRREIDSARTGDHDPVERDAEFYRGILKQAPEEQREVVLDLIADEAREKVDRAAARAGIIDHRDPAYAELPE